MPWSERIKEIFGIGDILSPQVLSIDSPSHGSVVSSPVVVSGMVSDNRKNPIVTVNGVEAKLARVSRPLWPYTYEFVADSIDVSSGSAVIVVRDQEGNHDSYLLLFEPQGNDQYQVEHAIGNPIIVDFHAEVDGEVVTEFDRDRDVTFVWEIDNFEDPVSVVFKELENPFLDGYGSPPTWDPYSKNMAAVDEGSYTWKPRTPGGVVELELEATSEDNEDLDGDGLTRETHQIKVPLNVLGPPKIYAFAMNEEWVDSVSSEGFSSTPTGSAESGAPINHWYWKVANADYAVIEEQWGEYVSEGILQMIDVSQWLPTYNDLSITPETVVDTAQFTLRAWSVNEGGRVADQTEETIEVSMVAKPPVVGISLTEIDGSPLRVDSYGFLSIPSANDPTKPEYPQYPVKLGWNVTQGVEKITLYVSGETPTEHGDTIGMEGKVVFESSAPADPVSDSMIFYPQSPVTFMVSTYGPGAIGPDRKGSVEESVILNIQNEPVPVEPRLIDFTLHLNGQVCPEVNETCYAFEGDTVTLSYDVDDAQTLSITESVGTHYLASGGIQLEGEEANISGTLEFPILNDSTLFTLVATNTGGIIATSHLLAVSPIPKPQVTFTLVEPGDQDHIIESGESKVVEIEFSVNYANYVEVTSTDKDQPILYTHEEANFRTPISDSVSFELSKSTTFRLFASGPGGNGYASYSLGYLEGVKPAPRIVSLSVEPSLLTHGEDTVVLRWSVTDEIEEDVTLEIRDGVAAPSSLDEMYRTDALDGEIEVTGVIESNVFTLTASNGENSASEERSVLVSYPKKPEIDFDIDTPSGEDDVISDGEEERAILEWRVDNATRIEIQSSDTRFELEVIDGNDPSYPIIGTREFQTSGPTSFLLIATGPGGDDTEIQSVGYEHQQAPPISILRFEIQDASGNRITGPITGGDTVYLVWEVQGAETIEIDDAINVHSSLDDDYEEGEYKTTAPSGSIAVDNFFSPEVFTIIARNSGSIATEQIPLDVISDYSEPQITFTINDVLIEGDLGRATLKWKVLYAEEVQLIPSDPDLPLPAGYPLSGLNPNTPLEGSITYTLDQTVTFALMAIGPGGSSVQYQSVKVETDPLDPPVVEYFEADNNLIWAKTPVTLSWSVTGADQVWLQDATGRASSIDGIIEVPAQGELTVTGIVEPQVFTLFARNADNLVLDQVSVQVLIAGQPIASYRIEGKMHLGEFGLPDRTFKMDWELVVAGSDLPDDIQIEVYAYLMKIDGVGAPEPNEFKKVGLAYEQAGNWAAFEILQFPIPLPIPDTGTNFEFTAHGFMSGATSTVSSTEMPRSIVGDFTASAGDITFTGTATFTRTD